MQYVLTNLKNTGELPTAGTGDVGAFYAISTSYAGNFVDDTNLQMLALRSILYGTTVAADGSWAYNSSVTSQVNGQATQVPGILICLDRANDQLVRFDPDTLVATGYAALGSALRAQSLTGTDYRSSSFNFRSFAVFDASTVLVAGQTIHVGRWH